jgi:hypothetical protein
MIIVEIRETGETTVCSGLTQENANKLLKLLVENEKAEQSRQADEDADWEKTSPSEFRIRYEKSDIDLIINRFKELVNELRLSNPLAKKAAEIKSSLHMEIENIRSLLLELFEK